MSVGKPAEICHEKRGACHQAGGFGHESLFRPAHGSIKRENQASWLEKAAWQQKRMALQPSAGGQGGEGAYLSHQTFMGFLLSIKGDALAFPTGVTFHQQHGEKNDEL
jgi:hypothetical protein